MAVETLAASRGLSLRLAPAGGARLGWGEADWLGPIALHARVDGRRLVWGEPAGSDEPGVERLQARLVPFDGSDDLGCFRGLELDFEPTPVPLRATVRAYEQRPLLVFHLEARAGLRALSTGEFAEPSAGWPAFFPARRAAGGVPDGTRSYGHQYTEFALPVFGDAGCARYFFAPHRPPVVEPLFLLAPDGRVLLLAPLDRFHEQVIAVPPHPESAGRGVRCGWNGDLDEVPAGFSTEVAIWAGEGLRRTMDEWARALLQRHATVRPSRYADDGVGKLSYWTDNGACYYYRTEPDRDYTSTLANVVATAARDGLPVSAVQLDSWFYPHRHPRPVSAEGATVVPPSGLMLWEPRPDLFPNGFADLRRRLRDLPLLLHSRHFASSSPYFERHPAWIDGDQAHPADGRLHDELLAAAVRWGAITYEQDWLIESFLGVRGLRAAPGRARAWQEGLDASAARHGLTLQWCMPSPADFLQTVTLRRVTSIRTSGDYRYLFDNGMHWMWFLHANALARALGLHPFKDVFVTHAEEDGFPGEPYAEVEALLAALSAGPVGIGDRAGRTRRELVLRTCREDGVLVKPDVPIAALERCFVANGFTKPVLVAGECHSIHPAGRWIYVASLHASRHGETIRSRLELAQLGDARPSAPVLAYDWRAGTWSRLEPDGGWDVELPFRDWDYKVLCPLLPGGRALFGDVGKYATAGDRRVARISATAEAITFEALGAPQTWVEVHGYAPSAPAAARARAEGKGERSIPVSPEPHASGDESVTWEPRTGRWIARVFLGGEGAASVGIAW